MHHVAYSAISSNPKTTRVTSTSFGSCRTRMITDTAIRQTLLLAFSSNQGTDRCDLIEIAKWEFSADPYTGRVNKRFDIVHSFEAKVINGAPVLCN